MKKVKSAAGYVMDRLAENRYGKKKEPYIKPSSLAKGCFLYVAFELQGKPKPPFDARVGRILSVGTDSHRRLQEGLSRECLAQEVFFEVPSTASTAFATAYCTFPTSEPQIPTPSASGPWSSKPPPPVSLTRSKRPKSPKRSTSVRPKFICGVSKNITRARCPLKGAIIYYENRDTLEHLAYEIYPDQGMIADLKQRIKSMLRGLEYGQLPDDVLPRDHWGHSYCPFLEICEPGQEAMAWQATQPKELPDKVMADIIAKRIVAKKGAEKMTGKKKAGQRSLADLAKDMDWS